MSPAENSKDLRTPEPPADPGECRHADAQIDEPVAADDKTDATPPIADGAFQSPVYFNDIIIYIYLFINLFFLL